MIPDGASLMIGGFMGVGSPERIIDEIVRGWRLRAHLTGMAARFPYWPPLRRGFLFGPLLSDVDIL
jgi:hypothetical protein